FTAFYEAAAYVEAQQKLGISKLLGHGYDRKGKLDSITLPRGQTTLKIMTKGGVDRFRYAAVTWLVDNNHPLREFETPAFRQMIEFANPEAADALW
ncbi:hypothetical protein PtrEW13061_012239, partial [Pyrenophora tritici-repentis]